MTPIATKNNAIILKDGKLAENCGCCGGWYCCYSEACPQDAIASVTASITAQDYLQWATGQYSGATWYHTSLGVLGSAYNGTHPLAKQSSGNVWSKTFTATPHASCLASITFTVTQSTWQLVFRWPILAFGLYSGEGSGQYKELSEMSCYGFPDPNAGYPAVPSPQNQASMSGGIGQCAALASTSQALTFSTVTPRSGLSGDAVSPPFSVLRVDGSNAATMTLSVT